MFKKPFINLENTGWLQYVTGFLCLFVYGGSLFFPLMDKDAAHHANIALYMYEHNDYVSLVDRGKDYLDKPHFLFWTSLLSFKLFGVNTFAHRFPALLFVLLSLLSTYRLARHLAGRTIAKMAVLMLATAQAFILSITDARMETPLTAFIIFGLWQLIVYIDRRSFLNLLLAALGAALAFSTKGWLGPVIIFVSAFFHLLFSRRWAVLASPMTWLFIPFFFLFITPVLYAYYLQYDLHPEKVIRGETGRSGIRFILWNQLFERAKGFDTEGRNSGYFFLYHTFLWAFFPWSLVAYAAVVYWLRRIFVRRKWNHPFNFAALSFAFLLITISLSKFKMPHYIIMLLPLAALFTAPYVRAAWRSRRTLRIYYPLQYFFAVLVLLATVALNFYFFRPLNIFVWVMGPLSILSLLYLLLKRFPQRAWKAFAISVTASLVFNFLLNYNFFPNLLKYQAGKEMVDRMQAENIAIPDSSIMLVETHAHSFDFYRKHNHPVVDAGEFVQRYPSIQNKYFLVSLYLRDYIKGLGFESETLIAQPDYNVATVSMKFLDPETRHQVGDSLLLVKFYKR